MIDGSNCTQEAVFPLFTCQNIVFPAPFRSFVSFTPSTQRNDKAKCVAPRQSNGHQRELAVENLPQTMNTRKFNR
jgi:hypothetical protein